MKSNRVNWARIAHYLFAVMVHHLEFIFFHVPATHFLQASTPHKCMDAGMAAIPSRILS